MVHDTFIKQKGKKISRKLDFKWYERRKSPNPFYDKIKKNHNAERSGGKYYLK